MFGREIHIMSLVNTSTKKITEYFSSASYYIPNHQREYSWTKDELEDLWLDINSIRKAPEGQMHFFGQVVIHTEKENNIDKKYIIDGQQRTLTSVILMRALSYVINELIKSASDDDDTEVANQVLSEINNTFIGSARKKRFVIHAGESNNTFFEDNILKAFPSKDKKEKSKSNELIRTGFWYFVDWIENDISEKPDFESKMESLEDIYDKFTEAFTVLYVESTELSEAYVIFETLNARGKDLETSDLLKNYIFSKSNNITQSQQRWKKMTDDLGKADATKYIRHFWNSRKEFTRDKALYRTISHDATTKTECENLLKDLESNAQFYHDLNDPSDVVEVSNTNLISSLKALKLLKAASFFPVLLAMHQQSQYFSEDDISEVASTIEKYVFKNFTICGQTANSAEVFFAKIGKSIYDGELVETGKIVKSISEKIVSDELFEASFKAWCGSNSSKDTVRYIFRKIHYYIDPDCEVNVNNMEVHIEHILPQESTEWENEIEDDKKDSFLDLKEKYLWSIGNLCLLKGKFNREISNKVFTEKKTSYQDSIIQPNPQIATFTKWDEDSIKARISSLYEYAKEIWKTNI